MMRFIYILLLSIFFAVGGYAQVMQTTGGAGGNKFRALKADSFLVVPKGTDTTNLANPKWGEGTTGALFVKTADSTLWFKVGGQWVQAGGNFTQTVIGNDTTIYEFVIDSTGAAANRVLFAGAKKIRSDSHFLWDSVNNKLVINHFNHSIGGVNTKLYVVGNTNLNGSTTTQQMRVSAIAQVFNDTTNYKPVIVNSSGDLYKLDRWPSGGGSGITQLTGDVTAGPGSGSQAATLATVNSNVGTFKKATVTANAKGLVTAISEGFGVDTIYRKAGQDSIFYKINGGTERAIKDSTGGGGGVTTLAAIGASPNANGATISGSTLNLQPANGSFGGVVTTAAQTFAGEKTFSNRIVALSATNSEGLIMGTLQLQGYGTNNSFFGDNLYFDGANWRRRQAGFGLVYQLFNGQLYIQTAPSGAAGGTSVTIRQITNNNGQVLLGDDIGAAEAPLASAVFEASSVSRGSIPAPSMTTAQRNAISSPAANLQVTNNELDLVNDHNGSVWTVNDGVIFTQTADATVSNTAAETSIIGTGSGTVTLPASYLTSGNTIVITVRGFMRTNGTPTLNIRFKLGSTTIASTGAQTLVSVGSSQYFEATCVITPRAAAGAAVATYGQGEFGYYSAATTKNFMHAGSTASVNVATNASQAIDVTVQWGTADVNNTITSTNTIVEIKN